MNQRIQQSWINESECNPKWFNSPVTSHQGTLAELCQFIPFFERRDFVFTESRNGNSRINEHLDTIVRLPIGEDENYIPVGVVSKSYTLVQHEKVLDNLITSLRKANIESIENLRAEVRITEYGERMSLSIILPQQYIYKPTDGNIMAIRLLCFNSVDGSTHFRAILEWFRLVCKNGLTIGVTQFDVRRRHSGYVRLEDIGDVLLSGLNQVEAEKRNFEVWQNTYLTKDKLALWANKTVKERWGFKAAARAYHIASSGYDAEIIGSYNKKTPTTIDMVRTTPVPGTSNECNNLFQLVQILAWLAKERRDIQDQIEWQESIPDLIASFIKY